MDNVIYSYGGGEALFQVLTGVKLVFNSDLSKSFIHLMTFSGVAWAAFQGAIQNSFMPKLNWVAKYVLITSLFITPTANLIITDIVYGSRNKVDKLPLGLVLPASVFSSVGYGITILFDQAFSTVSNNIAYTKYGQSFGAALISQTRNFKIQDSAFRENMENFIDNCVIYDVMVGTKYSASELKDSQNIWKLVSENASSIRMMNYRDQADNKLGRKLVTCKEGALNLSNYWRTDIDKLADRFGVTIFGKYGKNLSKAMENSNNQVLGKAFIANVDVVSALYKQTNTNTGTGAIDTLKQIMMINAISDIPMSYGAVRAKGQQQESWLISGQLAREILPTLHAIFAALIYASFTLIVGMLVLPSGFKALGNYLGLLIWIETWPPLFAVVNLLTNVSSKTYGGDFTAMTMNNASQIISHNNGISVIASGMMIVLPYLSYNILKGGAGQFVHLASQVMGASQSAAAAASSEVTSGNRSFDNVSISNGQWFNNSGFKTDMNTMYKAGHREHQLSDGTLVREAPDGNTILHSGPGVTHSVGSKTMHMDSSNSQQAHQSLSAEQSVLSSKQLEYDKMQQSGSRMVADTIDRLAASEASGEHFSYNKTSGSGKMLNASLEKAKEVHNNFAYNNSQTSTQSIRGSAGGNVGINRNTTSSANGGSSGESSPTGIIGQTIDKFNLVPTFGANLGGEISATGTTDSMNTQTYGENNAASARENVSYQSEDMARAMKDIQFTENQTKEKAMVDTVSGHYEKMEQLRESITVSQQSIKRYQDSIEHTQATSVNVSDDFYHKELNFIANLKGKDGFEIGVVKAAKIMANDDAVYQGYHKAYLAKTLPSQRMPSYDLNSNYKTEVEENIPANFDLKNSYNNQKEQNLRNLDSKVAVNDYAKQEYRKQSQAVTQKIDQKEGIILDNGEELQKKVDKDGEGSRHWFSAGRDKKTNQGFKE